MSRGKAIDAEGLSEYLDGLFRSSPMGVVAGIGGAVIALAASHQGLGQRWAICRCLVDWPVWLQQRCCGGGWLLGVLSMRSGAAFSPARSRDHQAREPILYGRITIPIGALA